MDNIEPVGSAESSFGMAILHRTVRPLLPYEHEFRTVPLMFRFGYIIKLHFAAHTQYLPAPRREIERQRDLIMSSVCRSSNFKDVAVRRFFSGGDPAEPPSFQTVRRKVAAIDDFSCNKSAEK